MHGDGISRDINMTPDSQYFYSENPVFKIKLTSLNNRYEEKQYVTDDSENSVKFKIGDSVSGNSLNDKKLYKGQIIKINLQDKNVVILNKFDKKKIKLDLKTLKKIDTTIQHQKLAFTSENLNHIMNFEEFCKTL